MSVPGKSATSSMTIIAAAVIVVSQLVELVWGYKFTPDDQEQIVHIANETVTLIVTVTSIIGGLGAIWGRVRASRPITSVLPKT